MMFVLLPQGNEYPTADAASRTMRPPWDCAMLRIALSALQPGDELEVDPTHSFVRLSGKVTEFKG